MTNGIDTRAQAVEATSPEAVLDCVFAVSKLQQLISRNHSMLRAGKRRDDLIADLSITSLS